MWIIILISILVLSVASILWPLLRAKESWAIQKQMAATEKLIRDRESLLRLLKDLEAEFEAGGIEQEEFNRLRQGYLDETVLVNRNINAIQGATSDGPPAVGS